MHAKIMPTNNSIKLLIN